MDINCDNAYMYINATTGQAAMYMYTRICIISACVCVCVYMYIYVEECKIFQNLKELSNYKAQQHNSTKNERIQTHDTRSVL